MLFKSYGLLACLAYGAGSFVLALPILLQPLVTSPSDRISDVASFERRAVDMPRTFDTDAQRYIPTNRLTVRDLLLAVLVDRELDAMYPVSTRAGGKVAGSIPEVRRDMTRSMAVLNEWHDPVTAPERSSPSGPPQIEANKEI